jgi:hypothetical protein
MSLTKPISTFTKRFLFNTAINEGDFDWHLYGMTRKLTLEEEALRQLNGLIESIVTDNKTYTLDCFKGDVEEAKKEIEDE